MLNASIDDDRVATDMIPPWSHLAEELHVGPVLAGDVMLLAEQDGRVPEQVLMLMKYYLELWLLIGDVKCFCIKLPNKLNKTLKYFLLKFGTPFPSEKWAKFNFHN